MSHGLYLVALARRCGVEDLNARHHGCSGSHDSLSLRDPYPFIRKHGFAMKDRSLFCVSQVSPQRFARDLRRSAIRLFGQSKEAFGIFAVETGRYHEPRSFGPDDLISYVLT